MSTRFNSHLDKPSKLDVRSKHRVLQDFKDLQESVMSVRQEKLLPEGNDPEPPEVLRKHLFDNPDILTKSEKSFQKRNANSAVVGDLESEPTREFVSYISTEPGRYRAQVGLKENLSKSRTRQSSVTQDVNLWDFSQFSSVNNKVPAYPRSQRGFVSFDLQTKRPPMKLRTANDARFLTFNPFP
jgi:hypothetical protein